MEKHIVVSMLWQIYGKLLTKKQYDVLNDYYNEDLSLAEIAENNNISRQGVRDIIKKGEAKLFDYEKKLQIMKKTDQQITGLYITGTIQESTRRMVQADHPTTEIVTYTVTDTDM